MTLEIANAISHPEGPEYAFQSGEGTYILRDDLQLATPPPHPSEPASTNIHPLSTSVQPPTSGVKLSLLTLNPRQVKSQLYKTSTTTSNLLRWKGLTRQDTTTATTAAAATRQKEMRDNKEQEKDATHTVSTDASSDKSFTLNSGASVDSATTPAAAAATTTTTAFGEGNTALTLTLSKDALKRRKPKNNIVKSNSSFVSRVITHDQLTKRLSERDPGGTFAFANINRSFQWLDLSSTTKSESLAKILFTRAHMLCHDVNHLTKDESHIDVVMGSSASDIIWYEPVSQKYARINKNGVINSTPVSKIKWIPGSESLFLAAHQDGSLIVYDKEKDDSPFVPESSSTTDGVINVEDVDDSTLNVTKSVNSSNQKANPVAYWKLSPEQINDFAFSPDNRYLAVVAEDGYLRIIDYHKEIMTDVFSSYYDGFTCVCWSPDGKYILTGGKDDLVSIWSMEDRSLVARCSGHDSWVTGVAFDPWRCDEKTYRFGSVGEDCRLLLWDFSFGMLNRPKGGATRNRGSISVAASASLARHRTESLSVNRMRSNSSRSQTMNNGEPEEEEEEPVFINHEVEPRSRTAQLPPIMAKVVDSHPLCSLTFEQDSIITSCNEGHVRQWDRPARQAGNVNGEHTNGTSA